MEYTLRGATDTMSNQSASSMLRIFKRLPIILIRYYNHATQDSKTFELSYKLCSASYAYLQRFTSRNKTACKS